VTENLIARARQAEDKRIDRNLGIKITAVVLIGSAIQFWFAQLIVWGLSLYHADSGIWGTWLLLEGVTSAFVYVIWIGMLRAMRDARKAAAEDRP
jgi:hypothetical protein